MTASKKPRLPRAARIREVAALAPNFTAEQLRERLEDIRRADGDPEIALSVLEAKLLKALPREQLLAPAKEAAPA